jgi:DNA polymerase III delta prime subunit
MSTFELWYEKYRPRKLDDYVWVADEVRDRITYWLKNPAKFPHLILHGPAGTGKTTLALLIAEALVEDTGFDLLFINTNKQSGVEAIREQVTGFCEIGGFGGLKVVIVDEADGLSGPAQDKMKSVINDYGDFVRFIFTTNNIRSMTEPMQSRARPFEIKALNADEFVNRLVAVLEAEEVEIDADIVGQIIDLTYPDMRKAIDLLQDCERDKKLIPPAESNIGSPEWSQGVADIILNQGGAGAIRELVISIRKNEIANVYRYLYEHSNIFETTAAEMTAITIIASYLKVHATVAFPDINLAGCLIELVQLKALDVN